MKTEYIPLHSAINLFEDIRDDLTKDIIKEKGYYLEQSTRIVSIIEFKEIDLKNAFVKPKDERPVGLHGKLPRELNNFLFLIENKKIALYGKDKKSPENMMEISVEDIIFFPDSEFVKMRYLYLLASHLCLQYNYNFTTRYVADFNYAVLCKYMTKEITHTDLSVRYDDFLELMKKIRGEV